MLGLSAGAGASAKQGYIGCVSDALARLEVGDTRECVALLKRALAVESGDPLARVAMGTALLMGGQPAEASTEFSTALSLDAGCAEAMYGRALVHLAARKIGDAASAFCQAQAANKSLDIAGAIRYAKYLAGAGGAEVVRDTEDESILALSALALMRNGGTAEAVGIWKFLQPKAVRPGFGERIGCTMTFVPGKPVVFTGWPLKPGFAAVTPERSDLQSVSGKVVLRADLSKARSVSIVSFSVDGRLVGVTNRYPFEYIWDTLGIPNGTHTVQITGVDSAGAEVSRKTAQVVVRNTVPKPRPKRITGPEADAVWARLWEILRLKPSTCAINYNLALCALDENDRETAVVALERVMAANPGFMDAAARLANLRKRSGQPNLHGVAAAGKRIALTFDDGPKPDTTQLLDILKQKNVRATFFLVGKQVEAYPEIARRIDSEGHEIQNHTYGHRALEFLSANEVERELFACAAAVRAATGKETTMVRPPGARNSTQVDEVVRRNGMRTVFWTVKCTEVEGTTQERMLKHVVSSCKPGAILMMHNADRITLRALPAVIDALRDKGYALVTLSELIERGEGGKLGEPYGGKNGSAREDKPGREAKS